MMIGDYAFVEFSVTGNALYVYDRERLPFSLTRSWPRVWQLKDKAVVAGYLTHQGGWEDRARTLVGELTGHWASSR
jgi:hypothetical protein